MDLVTIPLRYLIISWCSKNESLLLKSIYSIACFNQHILKSVLFANCCSNWSIFYDNRNESQSEGKVVPCITYNVWDTRSLTFRHKNTSYDLWLPTWSVHYLFSLLWIPTKPRWFHLLLDKNPTKQRIIVDIWFRGRSLSQPPAQNEVTSKMSPQLLPINTINGFHRIVPRILQRQVTYP